MGQQRRSTSASRSAWFYRRYLLTSPTHLLVLVPLFAILVSTLNALLALMGLVVAEVLLFVFVPSYAWTQRAIDTQLERASREAAAVARAQLINRMGAEHRHELTHLEATAALVRTSTGTADDGLDEDVLGLDHLLAAYVRLALAHSETAESLRLADARRPGAEELAALEARRVGTRGANLEALDRHVAVLRARVRANHTARDEQAAMEHDLATIAESIRLMREHCAAARSESVRSEVMRTVEVGCGDAALLRDLSVLNEASPFDAGFFELGRVQAMAPPLPRTAVRVAVAPPPPVGEPALIEPSTTEALLLVATRA